jgi:hypothetical protein
MGSFMICISQPGIIRVIKSGKIKCVGHVACMGERKGAYKALVEKAEERSRLGILHVVVGG